ncbi:MAG: glycosyltransferase [Desulfuromonadaceae bacterium]
MPDNPFISIIIPTYNRAHLLPLTLDSFLAQSYPWDRYEIIVSDNNSLDNTREVAARYVGNSDVPIRYLSEQRQGVHYARNSAAKLAIGDILYFTDDDMIADKDLLKEIIKPFAIDEKVANVTGKVLPKWEIPPPDWVLELCNNGLLSLMDRPEDLVISSVNCDVYSCHQAIKRDVFFQSGGYNPENTAGEWVGDGETGLNIKIRQLGYKFAYIGSSIIFHIIPPTRMTQVYLNKRMANQGNCDCYTAYRENSYDTTALYNTIIGHFWSFIKNSLMYIALRLFTKNGWRMCRAYMSYFCSRVSYDRRLINDESWRKIVLKNDWLQE